MEGVDRWRRTRFSVASDWQGVSTALDSEATLVDQPRGKDLEYRAVAINKAGDGEPSNTVTAVV